jgi:hypothetical protein
MLDPEYGYTAFSGLGGVFVIGVGMLALGVPLMFLCAVKLRPFFRGETLTAAADPGPGHRRAPAWRRAPRRVANQ